MNVADDTPAVWVDSRGWRVEYARAIVVCILVAAVASAALAALRSASVLDAGTFGETSGYEDVSLTNVYRTAVGLGPYGDLNHNATPALFNGLFYLVYGGIGRMIGIESGPVPALRFTSLLFISGAVLLFAHASATSLRRQGLPGWSGAVGLSIAVITLAGPMVGFWAMTVRPDAAALALETAALFSLRRAVASTAGAWWVAAIACALLAFGFKQNAVSCIAAIVVLMALQQRSLWCAGVFAAAAGLMWLLRMWGGPHYFLHVLGMAASAEYDVSNIAAELVKPLAIGWVVLALPLLVVRRALAAGGPAQTTALVYLVSLSVALPQLARVGASRNYLFTAAMAGALVLVDSARHLLTSRRLVCTMAAAYLSVLTLAYLAVPGVGQITVPFLDARPAVREQLPVIRMAASPKFIEDAMTAVPFNSGDKDIEIIDDTVYWSAIRRGLITETVYDRIARRYYASAFVEAPEFKSAFEAAGYQKVGAMRDVTYYRRPAS